MDSINTDVSSLIMQNTANASRGNQVQHAVNKSNEHFACDKVGAYNVSQDVLNRIFGGDSFFNNMAMFNDMLSTAQDTLGMMQFQGESILSLVNQAHNGEQTPESLKAINSEVFAKMAEIDKLYKNADFNGVNPFNQIFGFNVPSATMNSMGLGGLSVNELLDRINGKAPIDESEEVQEKEITEEIANIDVNVDLAAMFGSSSQSAEFGMQMSASIKIGYCDDGSLQISVDASLDYDLSGLSKYGAESDNAFDIINNFLNMIMGKQSQLGYASSFMDGLFDSMFASMSDSENGEIVQESSSAVSGKILQHATINLDGANQMPNIAINIL